MMKINIYYGGRGLIEDATIYVMNKLTEVFEDLRVEVTRYNLYEEKNGISMLPQTLNEADAVVLATSVEWFGIGGYMQQFLDACWLYGNKEKVSQMYMLPVVTATTYGERDAAAHLVKAWEMLGGIPCEPVTAYVDDHIEFETNPDYAMLIEKQGEMFYRNISRKTKMLPSSASEVQQSMLKSASIDLTPQESEQLSAYVSDDNYVKKQKVDIEELAQIYKEMLGESDTDSSGEFVRSFKENFRPKNDFSASYAVELSDIGKNIIVEVDGEQLKCYYGEKDDTDVNAKTTKDVFAAIVNGRMTLQHAFMSGELSAKGDFKILRMFDTVFQFDKL